MKAEKTTISLNTVKIQPGNFIAISSLSVVQSLHTIKDLCGEEATKGNIQSLIDLIHDLKPTV